MGGGDEGWTNVGQIDWRARIVRDPDILLGKPAVKGTRISVELILGWLASGWTRERILESYPMLMTEDFAAALAFAAEAVGRLPHAVASELANANGETAAVDWRDRIVATPETLVGKPRIAGTRIGVGFILELVAAGWGNGEILESYPHLKRSDLIAVFGFARDVMANETLAARAAG